MDSKTIKDNLLRFNNDLWKSVTLYLLNLKLNSDQGLALFRQKQIVRSIRHKNLENKNNEAVFRKLSSDYLQALLCK